MGTFSVDRKTLGTRKSNSMYVNASSSGVTPQPPVATPLDRVLQKAANKVKLAHPVAQNVQQHKPKDSTKRNDPRPVSSRPARLLEPQAKARGAVVDDDALFKSITESERDSIWQALKLEVEAGSDSSDEWLQDSDALPPPRRRAPDSARDLGPSARLASKASLYQPVASISGFKGFGAPPQQQPEQIKARPAPTTSNAVATSATGGRPTSSGHTNAHVDTALVAAARSAVANTRQKQQPPSLTSGQQQQRSQQRPGQHESQLKSAAASSGPLRVFLFNAEEARTRALLQALGLEARVQVVGDLRCADAVLAAKLARSGKHVNLTQGERTAANLGIPFLVVGRNMSAEKLKAALLPLLDPQAAASAAAAPATRGPSAAELRAHRLEMMRGFADMLKDGGVTAAPSAAGAGQGAEA